MPESKSWDYIIVGGGIGGCVVASRLKRYLPSSRILLVEAGPDVSGNKDILYFSSLQFVGGQFDCGYKSAPQKHYDGREIDIPAGRALGGSSVINACGWIRGAKADYDNWAEMVQDRRWCYENQLPYFKMTERWFSDDPEALKSHGRDGAMQIESPSYTNRITDMNGGTNLGLGELNENRSKGARQIAPADGTEISSSQEVIIAADAYRTPQLLMLSGIGPRGTLERHDITNFNDHLKDPSKGYAIGSDNPLFAKPEFATGYILEAAIAKDEGRAPRPTSRGTVTITSNDTKDPPLLDPNYFATEITGLMSGDTEMGRSDLTRPTNISTKDSCSMGKVVDGDLRVIGASALRIHIQAAVCIMRLLNRQAVLISGNC
ncbi:GMC oxidoreductase [Poronia punctata]|nr:GMC oxidoreductase [Poronia punctata]